MVLENVSLSLLTWAIVLTLLLIVLGSILLRTTRFRRWSIFPTSELRFIVRFARVVGFVLFIIVLMELVTGIVFGRGFVDTAQSTAFWYLNKVSFLAALAILVIVPRYIFTITRMRELAALKTETKINKSSSARIIDSIDWDILNSIKKHGGDLETLKNQLKWIDEDEIENRISKLHMLNYIEMGDYEIFLTSEALDILNLPPVLFASTIDDKKIIKKIAEIKISLKKEDANGVIVESSKLLEFILRGRLQKSMPEKDKLRSGKPLEHATLGDLIGELREHKLISLFEDNILTAINDIRKSVHSKDGRLSSIPLEKAYFVHSLTEIAVRSLCSE